MILDSLLSFSNGQALTAVGAVDSTNTLDLHMNGIPVLAANQGARDLGIGDPSLKIMCSVKTAFTSDGAGTLSVSLQGAPDNGAGAPGAFSAWYTSPAYTVAQLNAGSRLLPMDVPRPPDGVTMPRFLKLVYTIAGAAMTAGNVSSFIVLDRFDQPYQGSDNSATGGYAAGVTVAN